MTIREAVPADLDALVAMGCRFLASTSYRGLIRENPDQMRALATHLVSGEDGLMLVAEVDGALVGMIGCFMFPHPLSAERIASEVCWWVDPGQRGAGLKLLRQAEQWARGRAAVAFQMIAPDARVETLYTRLGFTKVETAYQKRIA